MTSVIRSGCRWETRVPPGQRCTQALQGWFTDRLGPGFRFDAPMRAWFAAADGDRAALLAAWTRYRSLPVAERGRA